MRINPLLAAIASPPIPEARGWLANYAGQHGPAIDLAQAVPGWPPPAELRTRLGEAAASEEASRYGPILGDDALREAYAAHVAGLYGGPVVDAEVAITAGCNQAFAATVMALAGAGDAVLLPSPWYFNHQMTLAMLGIEARPLPCRPEAGFVPDPADAAALIDDRVRAIVLVSPNNPTGAVYPPTVIAAFMALADRHGIALIVDETYRDFLAPDAGAPHALLAEGTRGGFIQLYSFSKAYGIPGHRTGAIVAEAAFIAQIEKVLDNLQICAPRPPQIALAWAIDGIAAWREAGAREIADRRAAFASALAARPEWSIESIGAYFAYVRHPGGTAAAAARRLAAEAGVLTLPGSYFGPGQEGHIRFAFANVDAATLSSLPQRFAALSVPAI